MQNKIFLEIVEMIQCERPETGTSWLRYATNVMSDRNLTPTARDIYSILLDMCTLTNNIITISLNQLAKKAHCCRNSVYNALKRLQKYRYINKKPKACRTEINTFVVFKILPDKKRNSSAKDAEQFSWNLPELQAKPEKAKKSRKRKLPQPDKKRYGKKKRVKLTDAEYNSLIQDFGKETVELYIQKVDAYCEKHHTSYDNNAETIRKWAETDRQFNKFSKQTSVKSHSSKMSKEELAEYTRMGIQFIDPTVYMMTDEEVSQILDHNYDSIYKNPDHPLFLYGKHDLYREAKRLRKLKESS
ncbi:MAG: hypothetical protein K2O42_01905 [Oscillospiraceae bacterium]|nr:hypothetical protein [Oscillospiraceae bacterium]